MGYPSALTAKGWGFYDVLFKGKPFRFQRPYGSYVIENVLFKIAYPTAFHGQRASRPRSSCIRWSGTGSTTSSASTCSSHNSTMVILDKTGPLANPADRDHCMQYMMAVGHDLRQAHHRGL